MDCHAVKKKLSDFLDSQLSEEQRSQIRHHLESCKPCTHEMKRLQASWETLGHWQEIDPSPHFKQRFWEKITEIENKKPSKAWASWNWQISWVSLGSLAAVLLVTLTWLLWPFSHREVQVAMPNQDRSVIELAASLDLLENKELLADMDLLDDLDLLLAIEETPVTEG